MKQAQWRFYRLKTQISSQENATDDADTEAKKQGRGQKDNKDNKDGSDAKQNN